MNATTRSSAEIEAVIAVKRARIAAITEERQTLEKQIARAHAEVARAIADGSVSVVELRQRAKGLSDEEWPLTAGLQLIESELPALQDEARLAAQHEAHGIAVDAAVQAVASVEALDTLFRTLIAKQLVPAIRTFDTAFAAAISARSEAERHWPHERRTPHNADPLPHDVARQMGPAMRLTTAVRVFVADLQQLEREQSESLVA